MWRHSQFLPTIEIYVGKKIIKCNRKFLSFKAVIINDVGLERCLNCKAFDLIKLFDESFELKIYLSIKVKLVVTSEKIMKRFWNCCQLEKLTFQLNDIYESPPETPLHKKINMKKSIFLYVIKTKRKTYNFRNHQNWRITDYMMKVNYNPWKMITEIWN